MFVCAWAFVFAHGLYECLTVGHPLCGLLHWVVVFVGGTRHALVHVDGDYGVVLRHSRPRVDLVDSCAGGLFPEEVSAQLHLLERHVATVFNMR